MTTAAQMSRPEISRRMASERASRQAFFGVSALLFAVSVAVTIVWCARMSAMGEMPMPGGWTMLDHWITSPEAGFPMGLLPLRLGRS